MGADRPIWDIFALKKYMKILMILKARLAALTIIGLLAAMAISCYSKQKQEKTGSNPVSEEELARQDTIKITLQANDKMQFDQEQITVYEGQTVRLELIHTGSMPKASMGHNFVLLAPSISASKYSKQALKEKENDYILRDPANTIAHTKMLGGGESDEIIFKAPKVGEYDFICSFPGHYANMKGTFIVK